MVAVSIDDFGLAHNRHALRRIVEMTMDVPMDEVARGIAVDQPAKASESPVAEVFGIVNVSRRRVGDDHVDSAFPPDCWSKSPYFATHLGLRELTGTTVVPARPGQSQDLDATKNNDSGV